MSVSTAEETGIDLTADKKERPIRKRHRVFGEKICQVCGDKALAHHFGTLACETCKAFFRRNASIKEPRSCQFKGDCPVNVKTRRFCPACRLAKCFKVGMRADLILDEKEKKERNLKVNEKRLNKSRMEPQKQEKQQNESDDSGGSSTAVLTPCSVSTTDPNADHTSLGESANMVQQAWRSALEMNAVEVMSRNAVASFSETAGWTQEVHTVDMEYPGTRNAVMDCKRTVITNSQNMTPSPALVDAVSPLTPSSSSSASSALYSNPESWHVQFSSKPEAQQTYTFREFHHVPREQLPSDPYMYWRLSEEERRLLSQLSAAYQDTLLDILKGSPPRRVIEDSEVLAMKPELYYEECESDAHCIVNFAKRMEDFRQLRQDEQIALLKASTCQVLGVRGCALYIAEKDAWLTRMGYFTKEHSEIICPGCYLLEPSMQYNRIIKTIVKNDVTLYALLHCLCLFDPCDEKVIDRQLISSIRDKYLILLRHYLESQYSYQHAERYMIALQENLIIYRSLCEEGRPLFKQWFPSIPNKLFAELLE